MSTFLLVIICICGVLILLGPIVLIGTSKRFSKLSKKYSTNELKSGITEAELTDWAINKDGMFSLNVEATDNEDQNAYSPKTETLYLSVKVLGESSVYSASIAMHEVGHAKLHQQGKRIVSFWYTLAVLDNILCRLILPFFIIGIICSLCGGWAVYLGDILLKLSSLSTFLALFYRIITIKNEDSASIFAIEYLEQSQALDKDELKNAQNFLNSALSTYFVEFYERMFYNIITVKKIIKFARRKNV